MQKTFAIFIPGAISWSYSKAQQPVKHADMRVDNIDSKNSADMSLIRQNLYSNLCTVSSYVKFKFSNGWNVASAFETCTAFKPDNTAVLQKLPTKTHELRGLNKK